jgi:hypothetical protein
LQGEGRRGSFFSTASRGPSATRTIELLLEVDLPGGLRHAGRQQERDDGGLHGCCRSFVSLLALEPSPWVVWGVESTTSTHEREREREGSQVAKRKDD